MFVLKLQPNVSYKVVEFNGQQFIYTHFFEAGNNYYYENTQITPSNVITTVFSEDTVLQGDEMNAIVDDVYNVYFRVLVIQENSNKINER